MVGRKGQGVCSCIVFPVAGEKDLPELPLAVIDGVAGEGPAQLLPPTGFSKEEGQIPGPSGKAMAAAISLPPVLYCSSGRWRGGLVGVEEAVD